MADSEHLSSTSHWKAPSLAGKVVLVTGASRGVGRGIASVFGETGATVYVTGRSIAGRSTESLPGTVSEVAELVNKRGGTGIGVRCDHTKFSEVEALMAQIRREQGRLDVLVNNAWGGYEAHDAVRFDAPFHESDFEKHWSGMFDAGVKAHLMSSFAALPLLLGSAPSLLVSTSAWDRDRYLGNLIYDVAKNALHRMVRDLAFELRDKGVTPVCVAPGFTRTERVMEAHRAQAFDLGPTESPEYVGRAIVSLAADPEASALAGRVLQSGALAKQYNFTDVDGRYVPPFELPDQYAFEKVS